MKIVDIREITIPLGSNIRNAVIDFTTMTISVVAIITDVQLKGKPLIGYGFNSNGRYGQGGILRERIIPRLLNAQSDQLLNDSWTNVDPFKCWKIMMTNEKPGGHGDRSVAVGTIDMALWDLAAKVEDRPLYSLLADRFNNNKFDDSVYVYAAGGYYYPGKDLDGLQDEFSKYLDMGFDTCKMKIGGASMAEDFNRIEAALKIVGSGSNLAVDANGVFNRSQAMEFGRAIEGYALKWYEEPVDPLDYHATAALAAGTVTPLATGENIFSTIDSQNLVRYGGLIDERDYLQFDPVLSYGLVEYLATLKMLKNNGWSHRRCIPHGGHLFGVHLAAGLGLYGMEAYPNVFVPFGYFTDDMILEDGQVNLPQAPGIGFETVPDIYQILTKLS
jgi:L-alanine-DL-glutamate epimerase-like enolase superfamily enzyme|tara:strand:- start:463 stop:1626 length:1164 start_codon:yes stop_codon:yes gene_type:complete